MHDLTYRPVKLGKCGSNRCEQQQESSISLSSFARTTSSHSSYSLNNLRRQPSPLRPCHVFNCQYGPTWPRGKSSFPDSRFLSLPRALSRALTLILSQVAFSVIVLALSANLVATQHFGGAPSTTNFEVFVGILGLVAALVGLAASFVSSLGGLIAFVLDGLTALFLFAGGVVRVPLFLHCISTRAKADRMYFLGFRSKDSNQLLLQYV